MRSCYLSRKKERMSKRGSVVDAIPVMIYFFVFATIAAVCYVVFSGLITANFFTMLTATGQAQNVNNPNFTAANFQQDGQNAFNVIDAISIFVFFGTAIASMLGALLLRTHPAFFFIAIVVLLMQVIIAMAFANTWNVMINNASFAPALAQFPITDFFLEHFPLLVFGVTILISIVLYGINPLSQ